MKKGKHMEAEIIKAVKEKENGVPIEAVCRSRHSQGYTVQLEGQIRRDGCQSAYGAESLAGGEPKAEANVRRLDSRQAIKLRGLSKSANQ